MTPVYLNGEIIFYSNVPHRTVNDLIEWEGKCYRVHERKCEGAGASLHVHLIE